MARPTMTRAIARNRAKAAAEAVEVPTESAAPVVAKKKAAKRKSK